MKSKPKIPVMAVTLLLAGVMYPQQNQTNPALDNQKAAAAESRTLKLVHREVPVYPQEALARDISGTVIVEAVVGKRGNVISARVIEGDKVFWDAALTAVKGFRYEPATWQGQPVESTTRVTINFFGKHGG